MFENNLSSGYVLYTDSEKEKSGIKKTNSINLNSLTQQFSSSTCDNNTYKVIMIGDSYVGKTSILKRYKDPSTIPNTRTTIGIDYQTADITIDGISIHANIWDTMGRNSFRTMTRNFFHQAKGVLLVYDVTSTASFMNLHQWVMDLKEHQLDKEEVFVIGNKIDVDDREVTFEEGKTFARSFGMKYFEVSARTGENVDNVVKTMLSNIKDGRDCSIPRVDWNSLEEDDKLMYQKSAQDRKKKSWCRRLGCCC